MNMMNRFHWMMSAALLAWATGCGDDSGGGGSGGGAGDGFGIAFQISGEDFGTDGFLFPEGSEATLRDGWELTFDHVLVTVGNLRLSSNPDKVPSDQSQTDGVVASDPGVYAVDLHLPGSVPGAGGEGLAVPLTRIANQNDNGGAAFASDERYAVSYDLVAASSAATKVNFAGDPDAEAAYAEMVAAGYSVMYVGTATFKGTDCASSDDEYDWDAVPTTVPFKLGFATPTSYLNCNNQDNDGEPFPDEEYQRGIAVPGNADAVAQLTIHLDHPFYSDVQHEPAIYFDQYAAQAVGAAAGAVITIDDLVGVDPTAFTDGAGTPLPWRSCDGAALPAGAVRAFEVGSLAVGPAVDPAQGLRDYADYVRYVQSSQGHLNGGEGVCFVQRNYASPR